MKLTKWGKVKWVAAIPFLLFVPASLFLAEWFLGVIYSFCSYYVLWLATVAIVEKKLKYPDWSKNLIFSSFGIIILQTVLVFCIGITVISLRQHKTPKMKLKKLEVPEKPNQWLEPTVKSPLDSVNVLRTEAQP